LVQGREMREFETGVRYGSLDIQSLDAHSTQGMKTRLVYLPRIGEAHVCWCLLEQLDVNNNPNSPISGDNANIVSREQAVESGKLPSYDVRPAV